MKKITVGRSWSLSAVSDDRWARAYKHPYELVGYSGKIDEDFWAGIERFMNFKPSKEAEAEAAENGKKAYGTFTPETLERIAPKLTEEIREAMGPAKSLIREFNIEAGSGEYLRTFAVFGKPEDGCCRLNPATEAFKKFFLTIKARYLNATGAWKKLPYPTHEELGY